MLDYIIRNVNIVDGSGEPGYRADIGIRGGKITFCTETEAKCSIDGTDYMVMPGFIDSHSHADTIACHDVCGFALPKISQGVTTEITGQCGESPFPVPPDMVEVQREQLQSFMAKEVNEHLKEFTGFQQYAEYVKSLPMVHNLAFNCGHSSLRSSVMGFAQRKPDVAEMKQMKKLLAQAMEQGCFGLTSGLVYNPGLYADTEELMELCKVIKPYHGIYATHIRNESNHSVEAVAEAITVAESAEVPLIISHHKVSGSRNSHLQIKCRKLIEQARNRGVRIAVDQYPYTATSTSLISIIPPKYFKNSMTELLDSFHDPVTRKEIFATMQTDIDSYENEYFDSDGFDNIYIMSSPNDKQACGLSITGYAEQIGMEPVDAFFELLIRNEGNVLATFMEIPEDVVDDIYQYEYTMIGSDGLLTLDDLPVHPRAYGTFVHTLCHFVKDKKCISLEQAVKKQTSQTASFWGIPNKGLLKEGYDADLLLIDYDNLKDLSSYTNSRQLCRGIEKVFVSGQIVYENGSLTGRTPGGVILHK